MKTLINIIQEKLIINKNSKVKQIKQLTLDDITKKYNLELIDSKFKGRYEYKLTKDIKNRFNLLLNLSKDELQKLANDINNFIIDKLKYTEEQLYISAFIKPLYEPCISITNFDGKPAKNQETIFMEISAILLQENDKFIIEIYNSNKQKLNKYENIICNVFNYIMENK